MTARSRLGRDAGVELLGRLEQLAVGRPALVQRLRRLGNFLATLPEWPTEFPLLAAAQAVEPGGADPLAGFRELRRTVAGFASDQGIDLALVVDGQKRSESATRVWWIESLDATDRQLRDLSDASTAHLDGEAVVPAYGRPERDGRPVVRVYFDVAPADETAVTTCIELLTARLDTDRDYFFERIPPALTGQRPDASRVDALRDADLVVIFLSPAYFVWSKDLLRGIGAVADAAQRVAPLHWSTLNDRCDLGPYSSIQIFGYPALGGELGRRGLDRLSRLRLGDAMADFHSELARRLSSEPSEPVEPLARDLAGDDEPNPVAARAVRTLLDKREHPMAATGGSAVVVVDHLVDWATAEEGRPPYFVVFGEYGMGKTVAAQALTRKLLERRDDDPRSPLPIYFDLRRLGSDLRKRDATLDELLADLIKRAWRTGEVRSPVTPADVVAAVQRRRAVVIFDGLDEVLVHMTEHQGQSLLRELLRILPPDVARGKRRQPGAGRVVLTCRTHFFRTIRDQDTFFRAEDRDHVGPDLYEALHLLPFDDVQIRAYLEGKQGVEAVDRALALIRSVHDLAGLATRPYNLRLISEQLERLERRIAGGGAIDAAALYDELVDSWLDRDAGKHQLERDHKLRLMEELAALLWTMESRQIAVVELESWLRTRLLEDDDLGRWVKLARPVPAVLAEDLRTATFIVRPGSDRFEFAHTSLLEYFLARFLHRSMASGEPGGWRLPAVSRETLDFLAEIALASDDERFHRHLVACGQHYEPQVSENVVRYAFRAAERGVTGVSLRGFHLAAADLRGIEVVPRPGSTVDMAGCDLAGADLRGAVLHRVLLDGADLRGAVLTRAELHGCSLRETALRRAVLHGAVVRSTALEGTDLSGATGEDSQWLWCTGGAPGSQVSGGLAPPTPRGEHVRLEVLAGPNGAISALAWSPDGTRLAAGASTGIPVWNPLSGAQHATLAGHTGSVRALAWSPDGTGLASAGDDGGVRLWDREGSHVLTIHLFEDGQWCVIGADGELLASEGEVWRWLRWRQRDPSSGRSTLLPAEFFGPLPGVSRGA